jgi:hypothetical protein
MREMVAEAVYDIATRGVAVVFVGTTDDLPVGERLNFTILRPDGTAVRGSGTVGPIPHAAALPVNRSSLFVQDLTTSDVPVGSVVTIEGSAPT